MNLQFCWVTGLANCLAVRRLNVKIMIDIIFIFIVYLLLAIWLLSVLEQILLHNFVLFIFHLGIPSKTEKILLPNTFYHIKNGITIRRNEAKFRFFYDKVYFIPRLGLFRWPNLFQLKLVGQLNSDNTIDIEARYPLGSAAFQPYIFLALTAGIIINTLESFDLITFLVSIIIWIVLLFSMIYDYLHERDRFNKMIDELIEIIIL
jgi:hypothetical protein